MMTLASLFNVPYSEPEFGIWSFANQDSHRLINDALSKQKGVFITLPPLDPLPFFDLAGWAERHAILHVQFTGVLGISGVDLSDVNFQDPAQLAAFIILHANEHEQAHTILGI